MPIHKVFLASSSRMDSINLNHELIMEWTKFIKDNKNIFYKLLLAKEINDIDIINKLELELKANLPSNLNLNQLYNLVELKEIDIKEHLDISKTTEYNILMQLRQLEIKSKKDLGQIIVHAYKMQSIYNDGKIPIFTQVDNPFSDFFNNFVQYYVFDCYSQQLLVQKKNINQDHEKEKLKKEQEVKKLSDIFLSLGTNKFIDIQKKYLKIINRNNQVNVAHKISYIYEIYKNNNPNFEFHDLNDIGFYINTFDDFFDLHFNYMNLIDKYIVGSNDGINKKLEQIHENIINNKDQLMIVEFAFINYCKRKKIYDETKLNIDFNAIANIEKLKKLYKLSNQIIYLLNIQEYELYGSFNAELVKNIKNGLSLPDRVLNKKDNNEVIDQFKIAIKQVIPRILYNLNLDLQMLLITQTIKATDQLYNFDQISKFGMNVLLPVAARSMIEQLTLKDNVLTIEPYHRRNSNNLIKTDKNKLLIILKRIHNNNFSDPKYLLKLLQEIQNNYSNEWFDNIALVYDGKRFTLNMVFFYLLEKIKDNSLFGEFGIKKCNSQSTFLETNNLESDTIDNATIKTDRAAFEQDRDECARILENLVKTYTYQAVNYDDLKSMLLKINEQLSFPSIDRIKIISLIHNFKLMLEVFARNKETKDELIQIRDLKQIYIYLADQLTKKIVGRNNYVLNSLIAIIYTIAGVVDNFISPISYVVKLIANGVTSAIYGDSIDYMDEHIKSYVVSNKTITNNTINYFSNLIKLINSHQDCDIWHTKTNEEILEIKKQLIQKNPEFIKIFIDDKILKDILEPKKLDVKDSLMATFMTRDQFYKYYLNLETNEIETLKSNNIIDRNQKIAIFNKIYSKIFLQGIHKDIILNLIKTEPDLELKKYFMYVIVKEIEVGKSDKKSKMGKLRQKDWRRNLILGIGTFLFTLISGIIIFCTGGIMLPLLIAATYAIITTIKEILLYQLDLNNYNKKLKPILDGLQEIYSPNKTDAIENIKINSDILKSYCQQYLGDMKNLTPDEIKDKIVSFLAENAYSKVLIVKKLRVCLAICNNQLATKQYEDVLGYLKDNLLNINNDLGVLDIINRNDHTVLYITAKIILRSIVYGFLSYLSFIKIIINEHFLNVLGLGLIVSFLKGFVYWFRNRFYNLFKIRSITNKKIKKILEEELQKLYKNSTSCDNMNNGNNEPLMLFT